ncbi:hypothetical protein L6452_25188 [Arctium lappa]|uniref:Uncharacterized protein n=1 Tax=Arctium lappa TaxID=4217 RepID=A0ACB9AA79_ARCLA|nr:hypothetical protein L6452_25188 [Arctium lappa]
MGKEEGLAGTQSETPEIQQVGEWTKVINSENGLSKTDKGALKFEEVQSPKMREERDEIERRDEPIIEVNDTREGNGVAEKKVLQKLESTAKRSDECDRKIFFDIRKWTQELASSCNSV